ncbi:MAG TPA: SemiSWEET family transporter [Myxococcota bacterium]|nr:SemiSWEET family transporter [Myxococcota bacterium]
MSLVDTIGTIALVITVIYTCFGLPVQIRKNYQDKSVAGLSLFLMIMLLFTFSSWVAYGWVKEQKDWYVIASNAPGALCVAIILVQFKLYRGRPRLGA